MWRSSRFANSRLEVRLADEADHPNPLWQVHKQAHFWAARWRRPRISLCNHPQVHPGLRGSTIRCPGFVRQKCYTLIISCRIRYVHLVRAGAGANQGAVSLASQRISASVFPQALSSRCIVWFGTLHKRNCGQITDGAKHGPLLEFAPASAYSFSSKNKQTPEGWR